MTLEIVNKRSSALNDAPTPAQLEDGEIGINYNKDSLALYVKDSSGAIRKIAGSGSESGYWNLTSTTLSPTDNTYGVNIGGGKIELKADGSGDFFGKVTSDSTIAGDSGDTLTTKDYVDSRINPTDLGIASRTAISLQVTSSTGTNATVPEASGTEAGLMSAADKGKLDGLPSSVGVTQIVAGTNISIDPTAGVGAVTINATGGGGSETLQDVTDNGNFTTNDIDIGGLSSAPTIELKASDGSAKFAGGLTQIFSTGNQQWGGDGYNGTKGAYVSSGGTFYVTPASGTEAYLAFNEGSSTPTVTITGAGNATFAGTVFANTPSDVNSVTGTNDSTSNATFYGRNIGAANSPVFSTGSATLANTCVITNTGTITAAGGDFVVTSSGNTKAGDYDTVRGSLLSPEGTCAARRDSGGSADAGYALYNGGLDVSHKVVSLNYDGSITAAGGVTATDFYSVFSNAKATLNYSGISFKDLSGVQTVNIQYDGSITAAGSVISETGVYAGDDADAGSTKRGALIGSNGSVKASTPTAGDPIWYGYTTGNAAATSNIYANGDATFAGQIESRADGFKFPDGTVQTTAASGGGGDVINYNGASAWGAVDGNGVLLDGLNASVSRLSVGEYEVTFTTPMPSADYAVLISGQGGESDVTYPISATGFTYRVQSGSALQDLASSFAVFATNALPPKGGTGTDAWVEVNDDGTKGSSFNVETTVKSSTGVYQVIFTNPMPTADYSVVFGKIFKDTYHAIQPSVGNKTTTGFSVFCKSTATGDSGDIPFNAAVNCTNATLPQTVTQEQIDSAINNPGVSAWALVEATSSGAPLSGSLNIASVTRTSKGNYAVVFTTPMPNADYSVVGSGAEGTVANFATPSVDKTATGFVATMRDSSGFLDKYFQFAVFATNALPPKGGTGTDAWASVKRTTSNGPCGIESSFNIASVTRTGVGTYDYVFTTAMPTANYAVQVSCFNEGNAPDYLGIGSVYGKTATGFTLDVRAYTTNALEDRAVDITVNATNAQLPDTFTAEQIQGVIDANPKGIASAWGYIKLDATIAGNYNIASVTKTATGIFEIVFTKPMSDANYAVTTCTEYPGLSGGTANVWGGTKTVNGFTMMLRADNLAYDYDFDFAVFSG